MCKTSRIPPHACFCLFILIFLLGCNNSGENSIHSPGDSDEDLPSDVDGDADEDSPSERELDPDTDLSPNGDEDLDIDADHFDKPEEPEIELPLACNEIYTQDSVPVFEIKISQEAWDTLVYLYKNGTEVEDPKIYQPLLEFKYGNLKINDAMIRLRGNPFSFHWWPEPKMQFNISFKQINSKGRFLGLRKINLDVGYSDTTLFHDRLAASIFHELELPAPCVNHAKLYVNGEFFGLYANIEHVDQEFLARNFGDKDEGNLYKSRPNFIFDKQTNEKDPDRSDIELFQQELTLSELDELIDLEEAVQEWTAEAIIPHLDGYFVGGSNFQLYNHPDRGFIFIPWDLDYGFEAGPSEMDPISYSVSWGRGKPYQMATLLRDEYWYGRYLEALGKALLAFDPEKLAGRIETYVSQTEDAFAVDPNLSYSVEEHKAAVAELVTYVHERVEFTEGWLPCIQHELDYQVREYAGNTYYLVESGCSSQRAAEFCNALDAELLTPTGMDEQNFLTGEIFDLSLTDWWIGANDLESEGIWTDVNGQVLSFDAWGPDQPDEDDWADCAVMEDYLDGLWTVDYCNRVYPFICVALE